jgi:large subunit ribosomal protein L25
MQIATLKAEARQNRGTKVARRMRKDGKLPGIIYGHGETPEAVIVPRHELAVLLEHGAHLIEVEVDGSPRPVLIKDVQFDHLGILPIHVDFARVDLTERVKVSVPLEFRGTPIGTLEGGVFDQSLVDLEIETLVTEIPESIRVNVAELKLGSAIHVKDVSLPPNVVAVASPETIVCSVRAKVAEEVVAPVAEETVAQPEIIGRKEKEEEGEGEEKK